MSKTKATGVTSLGRDSQPKYLGVKAFSGQKVKPGMIIVRQRGTKFIAGKNTKMGSDDTIYSLKEGVVEFKTKKILKYDGSRKIIRIVSVIASS